MQTMGQIRQASQKISTFLHKRLSGYLQTLTPLFAPRKVLGEFMESAFKEKVPGADNNFIDLEEAFKTIARETFDIPAKLGTPIPNIRNQLETYPWEYRYQIGDDANRSVIITSPVRWVLAYAGGFTLTDLLERQALGESLPAEDLKQFIIHSWTLRRLVDMSPPVQQLLADLRFPLVVESSEVTGELPIMVVNSDLPTFRPQDELIETVVQLSGKPVFEELIDLDAIEAVQDPFKARILELMG
ncbi:MAG: hypothetical protein ACE5GS_01210 [Kiloniellaceae bacterium]